MPTKTCFVIMGFGEKTDLETGRKLNLDMSYQNVIKPAIEDLGLQCERADEIVHSGVIDVPMYERLYRADVVVADLSTMNPNALYELGVRHALRPFTTVVIAESGFKNPFDVNHVLIRKYAHLGEDIGVAEARRFTKVLQEAVKGVLEQPAKDSPIYLFLSDLQPPTLSSISQPLGAAPAAGETVLSEILDQAKRARDSDPADWATARDRFAEAHDLVPQDVYVHQQLVLSTYKSGNLDAAKKIMAELRPEESNDPETVGIWGAIHKRAWDNEEDQEALMTAIRAYERGFQLREDHYNGINLAYLLNQRAKISDIPDAIADYVTARRVRRRVISICEDVLARDLATGDDRYWVRATLAEGWLGVGDRDRSKEWMTRAEATASASWMVASTLAQLQVLEGLLEPSPLRFLRTE